MPSLGVLDGEAETQSLLTEASVIVRTVPYMSPEQVKGEALDARSDIFSFGTVLYEMISGHQPFSAKTMAEIISAILTSEPPPLAHYSIAAPAGLEQILRKCLEKDRERRYQTMREVATDLENVRCAYESGASVVPTVDRAATAIRVAATNHAASLRLYLTSRFGLALAAVVMLAKAGKEREAEETIQRAVEIGKGFGHFHHTAYNIASAYALLNKPEMAVRWLQAAADDGMPCYPPFESDAKLNGLRKDGRFITFMAKMKRQWERYNATL